MSRRSVWMMGLGIGLLLATTDTAFSQDCTSSIGDFAFNDININGIQDAPDEGLGGVVAQLTDAAGSVSQVESIWRWAQLRRSLSGALSSPVTCTGASTRFM